MAVEPLRQPLTNQTRDDVAQAGCRIHPAATAQRRLGLRTRRGTHRRRARPPAARQSRGGRPWSPRSTASATGSPTTPGSPSTAPADRAGSPAPEVPPGRRQAAPVGRRAGPLIDHRRPVRHHGRMRIRPITPERLVDELTDRLVGTPGRRAAAGRPGRCARRRPGATRRGTGRPAARGGASGTARPYHRLPPAGVGPARTRADQPGRVLRSLVRRAGAAPRGPGPGRPGRYRPPAAVALGRHADRASRAGYVHLPPGGVVLVSGALLLGAGLPFDVTVHLELSPAALRRRTDPAQEWTLPAFARYAEEVAPAAFADVVVRSTIPDGRRWWSPTAERAAGAVREPVPDVRGGRAEGRGAAGGREKSV